MFGINGSELIILALLAVVVLGPEKLPEYTQKLAQLVKSLRGMAEGAREKLREEAGDEIADIDWRRLDPRQYDPRKIIRDALLEENEPSPAQPQLTQAPRPAALPAQPTVSLTKPRAESAQDASLPDGARAPFDDEAT
ncbi:Sec-independent protein translocase family protein [Galactobacter caseinivorans]|uniref:Sec-independent protein translocase TatB n=1 Tax=Galactobacter caseinivorans TaxID=2676123 RepID=A0A496PM49_9MICC|nr:Sec-independent protein translocase TatB [Galactobacter caseinivorans]RKW71593.1 Sec-independent protein translocase TatB [Galactobacter caseinivorans]